MPISAGSVRVAAEASAEEVVDAVAVAAESDKIAAEEGREIVVVAVVVAADVVAVAAEDAAAAGIAAASSENAGARSSCASLKAAPSTKCWTPLRRLFAEEVQETMSDQRPR